jgi:hypothetical protein
MKYCKQCACTLPDDYEDDICCCCYDDMHEGDNDESLIPSVSDKEYTEKVLHRRGVI